MAAYCACCGAEIKLKAEPCPVCKSPQHGAPPAKPQGSLADDRRPLKFPFAS